MDQFYRRAIRNIVRHGDTDIFPFPIENHVLHDKLDDAVTILAALDADVPRSLAEQPPANIGALAPVGYTGFRWAVQIDPLWNALYLSWVLSIADQIETARNNVDPDRVYSYRYRWDDTTETCFNRDINWRHFIEKALQKAAEKAFVVSCDISEFYLRINHHRIENAIRHLPESGYVYPRIKAFLSNLSNTYSFGIPIGGPASRLISELVLTQIDGLLLANEIDFVRYADDYFLFTETPDKSFQALVILTRLLIDNQGLQLQKSKTRIMTSAEFFASNPLVHDDDDIGAPLGAARQALMSINMHFDPYSATADEDYELLRAELEKYPVMEIIRAELKKSRVDITLARRLISLTSYLDGSLLDDAIKTLIENEDILYPVYHNVLICAKEVFGRLSEPTQLAICTRVRGLIIGQSRVMVLDLMLQYAIRLLSLRKDEETRYLFYKIFRSERNEAVKRDIILCLAKWDDWHWLSDLQKRFRTLSPVERRAFLIASFGLEDAGEHWRRNIRREFSESEKLVRGWAEQKFSQPGWQIPL
ncbi:MAG: RNA-directed DNA polymerase [Methylocystis sp.]|jgi:hypothetical protein